MPGRTRTITVKISESLALRLGAAVRRRSTSQSALVRAALEAQLAKSGADAGSCLDALRDLAGSLAGGPRDLAVGKRHLRGYGR